MIDSAHLLTDAQMRDFIVDGYVVLRSSLPTDFHQQIYDRTLQVLDDEGNPGNNILPRVPQLRQVFEDPAVVGALTSVLGPAQLLLRNASDEATLSDAEMIVAAAKRAQDLVHHLHLSTRGVEEGVHQPVKVNEVIREVVATSHPRWRDQFQADGLSVEVATDLVDVPTVRATASRLHDIILNLILNSLDAMPKGGTIAIQTRAGRGEVQIILTDTGGGMDEQTRQRVFEPFFTTKIEVGSGLGLSTAHNAVVGWGGSISVESTLGVGTKFTLHLPCWGGDEAKESGQLGPAQTRRGSLLVVEDDNGVRHLLSRVLGNRHEVESCSSGPEALALFASGQYDVALIDLGLPGVPGDMVARNFRSADPCLATVLLTGWVLDGTDTRLWPFDFRIQKPLGDLDEVEKVVARAIELHDRRGERRSQGSGG